MLTNLLSSVIEQRYEEISKGNWPNDKALLLKLSMSDFSTPTTFDKDEEDDLDGRYLKHELLIFGEHNYIGIYFRETLHHPDQKSDWYLLGYHDSCWRDTLRTYIQRIDKHVACFSLGRWDKTIEVDTDLKETLRGLVNNRRERAIHPLYQD